jgi:hypothetical protein
MRHPFISRTLVRLLAALSLTLVGLPGSLGTAMAVSGTPSCVPGGSLVEYRGTVTEADGKSFRLLPFRVASGTNRVEVGYEWTEHGTPSLLDHTTLDLALRDSGTGGAAGFRGWSGSNEGRLNLGQERIFVQADRASRGYTPGPIQLVTWNVELGIAAVFSGGADYRVEVTCKNVTGVGPAFVPDPVDPDYVARPEAGWYYGDMHVHAKHSGLTGREYPQEVQLARDAGLDFLPITEYVNNQHWGELGPIQRDNPDMVIWPGREIITYSGHAIVLGETNTLEYRDGFRDITLAGIQEDSVNQGALFQVAHPTIYPPPTFDKYCRGCFFSLGDQIDWNKVHTIEVLTGPIIVDPRPFLPYPLIQNPFTESAINLWEGKLLAGYKITGVSGSDDHNGYTLGVSATAVYASELSRSALDEALRAGHAYVRTFGVHGNPYIHLPALSPTVEMTAETADGQTGMFGDTLAADQAEVTVRVKGGDGQVLEIIRNGVKVQTVPIVGNDFEFTFTADRSADEGPLGTFWRVQTRLPTITGVTGSVISSIGNPIFLAGSAG